MPFLRGQTPYSPGGTRVTSGPAPWAPPLYPAVPPGASGPVVYSPDPPPYQEIRRSHWGSLQIPASLGQLLTRYAPLNAALHSGILNTGYTGSNQMTADVWSLQQGVRLGPRYGTAFPTKADVAAQVAASRFPQSMSAP